MEVGDTIKIHIPGETPWANIIEIISQDILRVSIQNHVGAAMCKTFNAAEDDETWHIKPLHDMKYGDEIIVYWRPEWNLFSSEREVQ
jgi:hypothetical protein